MLELEEKFKLLENPARQHKYSVTHTEEISLAGSVLQIEVVFIPDRHILQTGNFSSYIKKNFSAISAKNIQVEEIAFKIIEDLNNELIPLWIRAEVSLNEMAEMQKNRHKAVLEDRQPGFKLEEFAGKL